MKLDELEKMAQQTAAYGVHPSGEFIYSFYTEQLQAFAALVASAAQAKEREACARAYEAEADTWTAWPQAGAAKRKGAAAIRARGQA